MRETSAGLRIPHGRCIAPSSKLSRNEGRTERSHVTGEGEWFVFAHDVRIRHVGRRFDVIRNRGVGILVIVIVHASACAAVCSCHFVVCSSEQRSGLSSELLPPLGITARFPDTGRRIEGQFQASLGIWSAYCGVAFASSPTSLLQQVKPFHGVAVNEDSD